jgi:hypothetical protein
MAGWRFRLDRAMRANEHFSKDFGSVNFAQQKQTSRLAESFQFVTVHGNTPYVTQAFQIRNRSQANKSNTSPIGLPD